MLSFELLIAEPGRRSGLHSKFNIQASRLMAKTFTLAEAQVLLPILESLLRAAMEGKKLIEAVDEEFQALSSRIFVNGGTFVDILPLAQRKREREKAVQSV